MPVGCVFLLRTRGASSAAALGTWPTICVTHMCVRGASIVVYHNLRAIHRLGDQVECGRVVVCVRLVLRNHILDAVHDKRVTNARTASCFAVYAHTHLCAHAGMHDLTRQYQNTLFFRLRAACAGHHSFVVFFDNLKFLKMTREGFCFVAPFLRNSNSRVNLVRHEW
jgi:hypothetical protein